MLAGQSTGTGLQWGHGPRAVEGMACHNKNNPICMLQWGHGPRAVEGNDRIHRVPDPIHASMGPRPEGRGGKPAPAERYAHRAASMGPRPEGRGGRDDVDDVMVYLDSFNGATARGPWRVYWLFLSRFGVIPASMGPRPEGRGGERHPGSGMRRQTASMGPRPEGRGGNGILQRITRTMHASMGPRPEGRGGAHAGPDK